MNEATVELFKISAEDQDTWLYLKVYSDLIKEYLLTSNLDDGQLVRYMLIGLFPLYRTKVHGSEDFTTNIDKLVHQGTYKRGLDLAARFNLVAGFEVESSVHYYQLIGKKPGRKISADYLFEFVLTGKVQE